MKSECRKKTNKFCKLFKTDQQEEELALNKGLVEAATAQNISMMKSNRLAFARQRDMAVLVSVAMGLFFLFLPQCSAQEISNIAWHCPKSVGNLFIGLRWIEL
jgi:hypothetical protein